MSLFCSSLASCLLSSTADFLDNGIDENTRSLYDHSGVEEEEGEGEEGEGDNNDSNNNDSTSNIESDDYPSRPRISADIKYDMMRFVRMLGFGWFLMQGYFAGSATHTTQ